jgi:hypothetical protein
LNMHVCFGVRTCLSSRVVELADHILPRSAMPWATITTAPKTSMARTDTPLRRIRTRHLTFVLPTPS